MKIERLFHQKKERKNERASERAKERKKVRKKGRERGKEVKQIELASRQNLSAIKRNSERNYFFFWTKPN